MVLYSEDQKLLFIFALNFFVKEKKQVHEIIVISFLMCTISILEECSEFFVDLIKVVS